MFAFHIAGPYLCLALLLGFAGGCRAGKRAGGGESRAVPVEVEPVVRGSIEQRRTFNGTLDAFARG